MPWNRLCRVRQILILRHIEAEAQVEDRPGDDGDAGAVAAGARLEGILQPAQMLLPLLGLVDRLRNEIIDGRATGPRRKVARQLACRLGAAGGAARDLHDAGPELAQHVGQRQALGIGPGTGGIAASLWGRAEAQRAGIHAVADQPLHRGNFVGRGFGPFRGGLTHHIAADPGMTNQGADIAAAALAKCIHVFGDQFPGEVDPLAHDAERDRLGFGEKFEIPVMVVRARRGDDLTALTDQDRRVAVLHRGTAIRVPQRLRIKMGVVIDKAWGDDPAVSVDRAPGGAIVFADPYNLSFMHRHVCPERRLARAIHDTRILDQQIVRHGFLLLVSPTPSEGWCDSQRNRTTNRHCPVICRVYVMPCVELQQGTTAMAAGA